ncbi:MAG: tripartite tricarboxylate transporter substrate binding protein [Proteobacteria bacterium]|nr:tripartite tricarboxylate transporter substrate binding protein [Pseudomonadota bacterium]
MFMAAALPGQAATAAEFPDKPIRLICPYAPGGLSDILARILAKRLSEKIGQPVMVENRAGAGGIIGMEIVAKAAPDGYTIIMVGQGMASVNPSLYKNLSYDTLRDFAPIAQVARFSMVLVANPGQPPKSVKEFIELSRAKPGSMSYGSAGNASTAHLMTELFKHKAGIDVVHVPFKGEAPAITEIMGGRLSVMFATLGGALSHIQSGKLSALGLATKERSLVAPEIPTPAEAGVPDFEVQGWYGMLAPAGVPKPIVNRLSQEFVAIANEPELRERLAARGMDSIGSSPEAFAKWIQDEIDRWRKVVNDANIRTD